MKTTAILVVLVLGCGSVEPAGDPNARGETGAGGVLEAADSSAGAGAGGATAAGGRAGAGGATGTGGAPAGTGGVTGAGGATIDTAGVFCSNLGFSVTRYAACTRQTSPGVFAYGSKGGHACVICTGPPATTECWASSARELCVASCSECQFVVPQ